MAREPSVAFLNRALFPNKSFFKERGIKALAHTSNVLEPFSPGLRYPGNALGVSQASPSACAETVLLSVDFNMTGVMLPSQKKQGC